MKASQIEIGRLLQRQQRFCVPIYQRHYVWTRDKQWGPFWNDVRTKAIESLAGRDRRFSHFMGAVVLEARGGFSAGRVPSFQVVDGQQRLTTFQLFLAAARDYAKAAGFEKSAEKITDYILNDRPHLMEEPEVEIFKVWPTHYNRELFTDIIATDRESLRKKYSQHFYKSRDKIYPYSTVPPLLSAYGFFFDNIKHSVESDDLEDEFAPEPELDDEEDEEVEEDGLADEIKLDALWRALVEEFKVVAIELDEGDDAQVIFETLNERGEPLLAADLVRNNIFYRADANDEDAEKLFAKHWKDFEEPFWSVKEKQGRYTKPRIEFFLYNFISGKIATEINLTKLFSEYKAFLKPRKGSKVLPYDSVESELIDLAKYGAIYRELIERSADSHLAEFSKKLQPWDVTTVYPLVLRLWASDMEGREKRTCLDMLLSLIVRRAVCGLTTKNYNKFFLTVIAELDREGWSSSNMATFLLKQKSESGRFPRDEEFQNGWLHSPAYRVLGSAKARAVLEQLELSKRTKFSETEALSPRLTVEHVLPQNWRDSWPLPDGTSPTSDQFIAAIYSKAEDESTVGMIVRRNRLKETIGNLTLLTQPLNSKTSNGPYKGKWEALKKHSLLVMNREITDEPEWDEEKIEARSKKLFDIAKKIWKQPPEEKSEA